MQAGDVDFENNEITLVARRSQGKSRIIPLHPRLKIKLRRYVEQNGLRDEDYIFGFDIKNPDREVKGFCKDIFREIKTEKEYTPTEIRNTFIFYLISKYPYDLMMLKHILGITSLQLEKNYIEKWKIISENQIIEHSKRKLDDLTYI